ncbi:MAG TPA: hypothetical protein VNV42_03745 [Solirubrobacteraceae bacterium]|jgi:hypothetical protein|nr:hypothetical protein [Solirubrobacteraceae bacterium]
MPKREPECVPCRGTGKVISNLGGEQRRIPCPWCEGTGVKHAGVDAQAAWAEGDGGKAGDGPADASS